MIRVRIPGKLCVQIRSGERGKGKGMTPTPRLGQTGHSSQKLLAPLLLLLLLNVVAAVSERAPTPGPNTHVSGPGVTTRARVGLGIGIAAVFVVGIVGYIVLKRQRRKQNLHKMAALNGDPLREVTMHQDGAAGEQNLLGNGAAQH
ncbi:uncharacterized protein LOC132833869 isoform X4 [Hemiscyllium ocellatum]|uniref:uncharacterized protein LOC132833869 isoform X4 n=1 Tax=Hemiscyllium ocellatum TaxID=170820 RepID=UPI00296641D7|nr:uncharacterized protein LOC132833869 isoform X4 [Hemiscyllium ocellatum]